ncbi:MAG TPA: NHL repeat-containing protein [Edaphobacter sp.]|nr:NHL repeat-containing protein [Edaphobacter sp.]
MSFRATLHGFAAALGLGAALVLGGCGSGGTTPGGGGSTLGSALRGVVHGGQQPIVGSTVNLYAAGTSGYGTGAVSLMNGSGAVTTDKQGKFAIADDFTCPSPDAQIYLVAQGGDAGYGTNHAAVLMSALGSCGDLGTGTVIDVSEVSSVASVYALAQFMTPGSTAVGTSSTNIRGLANAFSTVANLIDPSTGQARATTPAGNGTVPQATINALANIIASCVNTKGDGACTQLFSLATPPGGTAPTDTLEALLDIALNPGNNAAKLYALRPSAGMFQPTLAGAPTDWTLSIEYTGGGLNAPQLPAIDGMGNIWVPNAVDPGTLSEFSPTGEPLSGTKGFGGGGLSYPEAVAVDADGNVWSANEGNASVSKHTSSGTPLSGDGGYTATGLSQPVAIALDSSGNVFTANVNNSVSKLNASGTPTARFTGGGLDIPYAVAIEPSQNNVWIANYGLSNSLSKFSNNGVSPTVTGYMGGGMSGPVGVAVDANGDVWVANFNSASVSKFNSAGTPKSGAGYATPAPVSAVAIDGSNTVWTANTDGSISRLSATGARISPSMGYTSAGATGEVGIVIDASGNVWTTDNYVNSIFEYVGAATPTTVPLQQAVKNNALGKKP